MPKARARSNRRARLASKKWKCEPTWMGRSPVLATVSWVVRRPTLASMSPSPSRYSPGIMPSPSPNGMMNRHQFRPVRERALDLHFLEHLGHPVHHVVPGQDRDAEGHQVGDGGAVPDALQDLGGDQRQGLRLVQLA